MTPEAARLKQIALERYATDEGFLYECSESSDYEHAVSVHGTAEAAWAEHLKVHEIQKENGGFYEKF
jgi:hypothetical protein